MRKLVVLMVPVLALTVACGGGSGGGTSVEGFCNELKTDNALFKTLGNASSDSDQAIQLFENLAKKAPSEIKTEMQLLTDFLKSEVKAAVELSSDPTDSRSSSREAEVSASSSSLNVASDKLSKFATDKC